MNRDNPIWNASELVDERSGAPRLDADDDLLGVDWGDVGRKALGGSALAGKVLLNAFGASAVVAPVEAIQQRGGALPQWATKSLNVVKPDAVILAKNDGTGLTIRSSKVVVFGGNRFDGPGYVKGTPGSFSFGVDQPVRIEVPGNKYTDVQQILFLGGIEASETVMGGNTMSNDEDLLGQIECELLGDDAAPIDPAAAIDTTLLTVPPPPAALSSQQQRWQNTAAYKTAYARAQTALARAQAAQAQQALTVQPVTLQPITVPSLNLNLDQGSFAMPTDETVSGVDSAIDIPDPLADDPFTEVLAGEEDDYRYEDPMDPAGDTEINSVLGDAYHEEGWAEIVGADYFVGMTAAQRKKLLSYMKKIKKTILSGDRGDAELVGMSEAQRRRLKAYMDKIKRIIVHGDAVQFVPCTTLPVQTVPDHVLGSDVCGATAAILSAQPTKPGLFSTLLPARQATAIAPLARKSAVPIVKRTVSTIKGKRTFKVAGRSTNKSPHKLAYSRAGNAMNRAVRAGTQAQNRAALHKPKLPTVVHGDLDTVFGAVEPRQLTPRQVAAVQKRDNAIRRAAASAARATKTGANAVAASKRTAAAMQKAKPVIAKLLKKAVVAPTKVHGFEFMLGMHDVGALKDFGLLDELVGAMPGDPNYDPRFDGPYGTDPTTGQPYTSPQGGTDPSGGGVPYTDPGSSSSTPLDPSTYSDGGDIPLPARGGILSKDDASVVYHTVPDDGVIYQGEKGFPVGSLGSWSRFYGPDGNGKQYLSTVIAAQSSTQYTTGDPGVISRWVQQHPNSPLAKAANNNITPGFEWSQGPIDPDNPVPTPKWMIQDQPADWTPIIARVATHPEDDDGEIEKWANLYVVPATLPDVRAMAQYSVTRGWGPLIGNPNGPLAGLQFAMDTGDWFWQSQNAPVWATKAQDDQIVALNKAANDAAATAAQADQARLQQEADQQAEAQANQDAQLALAQQAADSQAAIAQQQLDQQQQIADSQAAAAQTALELQATKADLTYGQQQAALEQQAAQADLDWAIAHPAETAQEQQQMADQQEQGAPDEGDLGDMSNTTDRGTGADQFDRSSELDLAQREGSAVTDDQFANITEGTTSTEENEAAAAAFDET